jgi:hypothetical protein
VAGACGISKNTADTLLIMIEDIGLGAPATFGAPIS